MDDDLGTAIELRSPPDENQQAGLDSVFGSISGQPCSSGSPQKPGQTIPNHRLQGVGSPPWIADTRSGCSRIQACRSTQSCNESKRFDNNPRTGVGPSGRVHAVRGPFRPRSRSPLLLEEIDNAARYCAIHYRSLAASGRGAVLGAHLGWREKVCEPLNVGKR